MMAVGAAVLSCLVTSAMGGGFLHTRPHTEKSVGLDVVQQTFAAALSMDPVKLHQFEDDLRPMYIALPKDAQGALEPAVVRYALHRYFVQKHGWHIKGLQAEGQVQNASSPAGILKDHVPEYVQGLLEKHVSGQGWGLHELAICSAAIEELIQREFLQDLEFVYGMLELPIANRLGETELDDVITTYLAQYLAEEDFTDNSPVSLIYELSETYSFWGDLQMWAKDLRQSLDLLEASRTNPFRSLGGYSFERVAEIIQEIMGHYTSFQNLECGALTDVILDLEHSSTGRVPLSKFYGAGLAQKWKFWEPKAYLQHAGALDESDAKRPSVIIPNYVYGMNNCLASSSFFSVCCTNKCERLVGHLEQALAAPSASPERIAALVSQLPSDTVDAPRQLPSLLLTRLEEIAAQHGGDVPLHGRLFSQWLHHAYPRECPFPHVESEQNPLTPEAWAKVAGTSYTASDEDMRRYMRQHRLEHDQNEELLWMATEQLIGTHPRRGQRHWWQKAAAMIAVVVVASSLLRAGQAILGVRDTHDSKQCKHLV